MNWGTRKRAVRRCRGAPLRAAVGRVNATIALIGFVRTICVGVPAGAAGRRQQTGEDAVNIEAT